MGKHFHKYLVLVMVICLVVSMLPAAVSGTESVSESAAAENSQEHSLAYMSGTCGSASWTVDWDGTLTISGTGSTNLGTMGIDDIPWTDAHDMIKTVVISEGITSIGEWCCWTLVNVTSIYIPTTVTSIGQTSLAGTASLQNIYVTSGNAYYASVDGVLYNAAKTRAIWCGTQKSGHHIMPEGVTRIEGVTFSGCDSLTGITIPSSVRVIENGAFSDCPSLTSATYNGNLGNLVIEANNEQLLYALGIDPDTYYAANNLTAYAKDKISTLSAGADQTVTLSVVVSAMDQTNIQYQWERKDGTAYSELADENKASLSFRMGSQSVSYRCKVTDRFGNTVYVVFTVNVKQVKTGWQNENGKTRYYLSTGKYVTGWKKISGKWYYFDTTGGMVTGWKKLSGKWYYLGTDGVMRTNWQKVSGKWYYLGTDGVMRTGWQQVSSKWYYLGTDGAMRSGWQKISNKWYYLGTDGVMRTGWQKISSKWYYLGTNGVMVTGWQKVSGKWYFMDASGVMLTGWQKIGSKWYYLGTDGVMVTGWQKISSKWYYFNSSGAMVTGTQTIGGKTYTFNASGVWVS